MLSCAEFFLASLINSSQFFHQYLTTAVRNRIVIGKSGKQSTILSPVTKNSYPEPNCPYRGRTGAVVSAAVYGPRGPWFETLPGSRSLWP